MLIARKSVLIVLLSIGLFIVGFFYLLRGCLSRYDERSAVVPVLYFEKDGRSIVFSIVKFDKTTSYSQKGGFISKSVSSSYYIQTNDAATGQKIDQKKIVHHSDLRTYTVEVVGASDGLAWVFMGQLMAFDPFTLEQKAGIDILEEKNPLLKGKFPAERRYYDFNREDRSISVTAADGASWRLNTSTLDIQPVDDPGEEAKKDREVSRLEKLVQANRAEQDSLFEQMMRRPSRMLAAKEITVNQYRDMVHGFQQRRARVDAVRDSLRALLSRAEKHQRAGQDLNQRIASLNRSNLSFSQIKVNMDTINGKWYGLYAKAEMEKLYNRFQYQQVYGETARRQLMTSTYTKENDGDLMFDKTNATTVGNGVFLDGGILADKLSGKAARLPSGSLLIVYKDIIGNEGKIQVCLLDRDGKSQWTYDTQLKDWSDWIVTEKYLIILGTNNKELSSGQVNLLLSINLSNGQASSYDFFTDKS